MRGSEIQLLQALEEKKTLSELADRLDLSESYVSELVTRLEEQDLVYTKKDGRRKYVQSSGHRIVELIQELGHSHPHIDFAELLTPKTISILYYLDTERSAGELADLTDNYRNTVYRILNKLTDRGICGKTDSTYRLNNEFKILNEIAVEYASHRHALATPASSFTIIWESLDEFLLQTQETITRDAFYETGPNRFEEFNLPLLTTKQQYYFYSETLVDLTPAELLCHTLLIDDGTRYQTYCLLLIERHGLTQEDTLSKAEKYGVTDTVEKLFTYLQSRGEKQTPTLPEWNEFESIAKEYEVTI